MLDKAAGTTKDYPSADVDDTPGMVPHLHDLRIEQVCGGHKSRFRLTTHFAPTSGTIDHSQHLEQRGGVGLPSIGQKEGDRSGARDDLRDQCGRHLLRARAGIDPQEKPAAHGQGGMNPRYLAWTQFRMGFIQLYS